MNYQERIRHCIELTKTLDPNKVDLVDWQHPCGATRCVIGHLCATPEAQALGLRLSQSHTPTFGVSRNWGAVAKYFGIHEITALHIFGFNGGRNRTAEDVRKKLEELVK